MKMPHRESNHRRGRLSENASQVQEERDIDSCDHGKGRVEGLWLLQSCNVGRQDQVGMHAGDERRSLGVCSGRPDCHGSDSSERRSSFPCRPAKDGGWRSEKEGKKKKKEASDRRLCAKWIMIRVNRSCSFSSCLHIASNIVKDGLDRAGSA